MSHTSSLVVVVTVWVLPQIPHRYMRCVTILNELCHTYEWWIHRITNFVPRGLCACVSHVTRMNKLCHTYKCWISLLKRFSPVAFVTGWVMSQIWMSYEWVMSRIVTHMNESCHAYVVLVAFVTRWVMSLAWIRMCHAFGWFMSHMWMGHVTHVNASGHVWMRCVARWCHVWMSHVAYASVTLHMNESCPTWCAVRCAMSHASCWSHESCLTSHDS